MDILKVNSLSGQYPVSSIQSGSDQGQVSSIRSQHVVLAQQQQRVYLWFLDNGISGYFNKGIIHRETSINLPTIRKCVAKLKDIGLLKIGVFDPVSRLSEYSISRHIKVHLLGHSRSELGQDQVSNIGAGSGLGQVTPINSSNKTERKIIKDLSFFVQNSEFWKKQGLNITRIERWLNDDRLIHCTPEFLLLQLRYGEIEPQVKNADKPLDYFFATIVNGGLQRPKDYESPEEKVTRILQEDLDLKEQTLAKQVSLKQECEYAAAELAFQAFLDAPDNIDNLIYEIEKGFVSRAQKARIKSYKETGELCPQLRLTLKTKFEGEQ